MEAGAATDLPSSKGTRQGAVGSPLLFNRLLNLLLRLLRHEGLAMSWGGGQSRHRRGERLRSRPVRGVYQPDKRAENGRYL